MLRSNKLKSQTFDAWACVMSTVSMNLEFLVNVCRFLPSLDICVDKRIEADEMLTAAFATEHTCTTRRNSKTHPQSAHRLHTHCTLERKQQGGEGCLCLLTKIHPPAWASLLSATTGTRVPLQRNKKTHGFFILLLRAAGFLGLLNDSIEGKAQAAHAGQIRHVYVKLQLLIPKGLGAHSHLRARHHLTKQLTAVEQAGLHHKLQRRSKNTYRAVIRHDMWSRRWRL